MFAYYSFRIFHLKYCTSSALTTYSLNPSSLLTQFSLTAFSLFYPFCIAQPSGGMTSKLRDPRLRWSHPPNHRTTQPPDTSPSQIKYGGSLNMPLEKGRRQMISGAESKLSRAITQVIDTPPMTQFPSAHN